MSLRVGVDLDGVVADFRSAFEAVAVEAGVQVRDPQGAGGSADMLASRDLRRVWDMVKRTPNWWVRLSPYEPGQTLRLYELTRRLRWEVVFMTRRPSTEGDPVQFQTQWWLEKQGFFYPAVVTVPGSRGDLANALRLDVVIDDQLMNCIDVVSGSTSKAVLLVRDPQDASAQEQAVSRGIGVVTSLEQAIDVLEHLHETQRDRRGRLHRLADWFTGGRSVESSLPDAPPADRVTLRDE